MNAQEATRIIRELDLLNGDLMILQIAVREAGLTSTATMFDEAEAQIRAIQTVIDEAQSQPAPTQQTMFEE